MDNDELVRKAEEEIAALIVKKNCGVTKKDRKRTFLN